MNRRRFLANAIALLPTFRVPYPATLATVGVDVGADRIQCLLIDWDSDPRLTPMNRITATVWPNVSSDGNGSPSCLAAPFASSGRHFFSNT